MDKTGYELKEFRLPCNVVYGLKSINLLAEYARDFGKTALLVTGRAAMKKIGITAKIVKQLSKENIKAVIFDKIEEDPSLETVDNGIAFAKKEKADFVIGLGGGSALDAAKAIAGIFNENCSVREFAVNDKPITRKGLKFIACPTTSGSGTEVTKNAVLTIPEIPAKKSIRHSYLMPDLAIVDAELTVSLSKEYTAACGMDALTHAVEAYTSINSFAITDTLALKAVSLIADNLLKAFEEPENMAARENMALASNFAGMAFSNAGLGAAHALAHPIGVYYKIPHGTANAVLLIAVMKFNLFSRESRFLEIAKAFSKDKKAKSGEEAIKKIEELKKKLNLNIGLKELGITKKDFPVLARGIKYSASVKSNPVPCGEKELIRILDMAY
ncbi:MAG: iron-containing alcohol dehydrogenase [Candidatus Omnitrophota bacterium]